MLHQSIAIARYVAANTELLPSDPWQQALLDAAVLTIYDFDQREYHSRFIVVPKILRQGSERLETKARQLIL